MLASGMGKISRRIRSWSGAAMGWPASPLDAAARLWPLGCADESAMMDLS